MIGYSLVAFCLYACNNKSQQAEQAAIIIDSTVAFFPVTSFLKGQLIALDSLPITVLRIVTIKGKSDSFWIKKENVQPLLDDFFTQEINTTNLTAFFKESKFNDEGVDAITYTYEPKAALPDSILLKHWDVYVKLQTGKVKRVYMVKQVKQGAEIFTLQLTWVTDKWAKIVTILNKSAGESELIKEEQFVWGL